MEKIDYKKIKTCFEVMRIICRKNNIKDIGIGKPIDNGSYIVYCKDNKYHVREKCRNKVCGHGKYEDAGEALRRYVYIQTLDDNYARSIEKEFDNILKTVALFQKLRGNLNANNQ